MQRREFLLQNIAFAFAPQSGRASWNSGSVVHLLPTVSDRRILVKTSFKEPLREPRMRVGNRMVDGVRTDSEGRFFSFDASGLQPATSYELQLLDGRRSLCAPWKLKTFPDPSERVSRFRLLIYTCAGGHPVLKLKDGEPKFLTLERRRRMLNRALSFAPDAAIANGDHVYWDLLTSGGPTQGASPEGVAYAGRFLRTEPVWGTQNESVLKRAVGPQIASLYGTDFRETPVFFVTDDHDHFDNDEADDTFVSFPPDAFMMRMARASRRLYYPEFLPDPNRPAGLAGASADDTPAGTAEAFGTLRYGRLAEILLYDCRRFLTLAGATASIVPRETEAWIKARLAAKDLDHVVQVPSLPIGWSAGKWGDWYPDFLDAEGKLNTRRPKPYWQPGWASQHDRLLAAASANGNRIPLFLCGDLHAIGETRIRRTGSTDLSRNPVVSVLTGPISTGRTGWPSSVRNTPPLSPERIEVDQRFPAQERHGFVIADFIHDRITLQFFRWSVDEPDEAIDRMEPFRVTELKRGTRA